jgi:hypothetical protein
LPHRWATVQSTCSTDPASWVSSNSIFTIGVAQELAILFTAIRPEIVSTLSLHSTSVRVTTRRNVESENLRPAPQRFPGAFKQFGGRGGGPSAPK